MSDVNPMILGRGIDDEVDVRAETTLIAKSEVEYVGGAIGKLMLRVFRSTDSEDRGGIVIRIEVEDFGSSFIPHTINIANGVEIHMAGDAEAEALLRILQSSPI